MTIYVVDITRTVRWQLIIDAIDSDEAYSIAEQDTAGDFESRDGTESCFNALDDIEITPDESNNLEDDNGTEQRPTISLAYRPDDGTIP